MNEKQQAYINSVSMDRFVEVCEQLWRDSRCPLIGDMEGIIIDEYNNDAIDKLLSDAGLWDNEELDDTET